MTEIDLTEKRKIHFIGIGGVSMSAIANILLSQGHTVSGSDSMENEILEKLKSLGATVYTGHRASNVANDVDFVIYTAAIHPDNPEIIKAKELGIELITRAGFLGMLMKQYKTSICVSGTHGKTTTTSLISRILVEADADPTITVGGFDPFLGGNLRIGTEDMLLTEACEYTNSFLSFNPTHALILNIQEDHLDFFKDIDDIRESFKKFAHLLPAEGTLVINGEIENISFFTEGLDAEVKTFGLKEGCEYRAINISYDDLACPSFDIEENHKIIGHIKMRVPGEHNLYNALAAFTLSESLGIPTETSIKALENFSGVDRRFQIKGKLNGATVIDDYAHHPEEIKATLTTAKKLPYRKLWCVFQPHTYTRTKALFDEFIDSLSLADAVVFAEIYAAREKNELGISSKDLEEKMTASGKEAYYFPTFDEIENFLLENLLNGDVLITMGAGDVVNIGDKLLGL